MSGSRPPLLFVKHNKALLTNPNNTHLAPAFLHADLPTQDLKALQPYLEDSSQLMPYSAIERLSQLYRSMVPEEVLATPPHPRTPLYTRLSHTRRTTLRAGTAAPPEQVRQRLGPRACQRLRPLRRAHEGTSVGEARLVPAPA